MASIKTSALTGAALDWAVAVALGWKLERPQDGQFIDDNGQRWLAGLHRHAPSASFYPSTNWAQCGPLLDKYKVDVMYFSEGADALVVASIYADDKTVNVDGPTALIAICRAVVAYKLGHTVDIPQEMQSAP